MNYSGLSDREVNESVKKYGTNSITKKNNNTFIKLLLESLSDPIIRILIIALLIKIVFLFQNNDWYETIGIFIAIFIASLVSSLSEYGSEKAFEKMESEVHNELVKVKRNNKLCELDINEIVIGDIIILESGDKVPADLVILEGNVNVDESSLTGETIEKEKKIGDELYRSSSIYSGHAIARVKEIGDKTFYGKLAVEIQESSPVSPLKIRLIGLAKVISIIGYISAFLVSFSYLFKVIVLDNNFDGNSILNMIFNYKELIPHLIYALTLAVTLIVVSVPEGLPMMVALVLSSNMKRMLKKNVLVRKLVGIETAGSLNILFTDKTGTLTEGKFSVINFIDGTGTSYSKEELKNTLLYNEVRTSLLYNTESVYSNNEIIGGNITEKALLSYIGSSNKNKKVLEYFPFNSENKFSYVLLDNNITYIKGAREVLLNKCDYYLDPSGIKKKLNKEKFIKKIELEENNGNRIICLASTTLPFKINTPLTLLGFVVIKDKVRPSVKESIKEVTEAGIQVVMVTGDNKNTASSIARELGIIKDEKDLVLTSKELNSLSDESVKKILPNLKVVARLLPQDKSRLIKLSRELDLTVGMTGDGVNDAPALKRADVGFSMGSGTEVAKEASDIVILDNNFSSISSSILFGRTIFKSIRKFIIFQLTVNMCAIITSVLGPFIGIDTPVTVIQMLWINMVMDSLAALAFSYEPPLKEYMKEPPKKKNENILNRYMISEILFTGIYTSMLCIFFLKSNIIGSIYRIDISDKYLMTAFFGLFIFAGVFNSFNARTNRLNLLSHLKENKVFLFIIFFIVLVQIYLIYYGGTIFRTTGLSLIEFNIMLILASSVIPIDILRKIILRLFGKKGSV